MLKLKTRNTFNGWFPLGSINLLPVHCLTLLPKIFLWEHKFVALNLSPKMKGNELAMKCQKALKFVPSSWLFISDLMIKVSDIKEILLILTIDLKFLFKT